MSPDDELAALWYWLAGMCYEVQPPLCYICKGETTLVPPEELFYVCGDCFPDTFGWSFLEDV